MVIRGFALVWIFVLQSCGINAQKFIISKTEITFQGPIGFDSIMVYSKTASNSGIAILGEHSRTATSVSFKPFVPFQLGKEYFARFGSVDTLFSIEVEEDYKYAKVASIYPTNDTLPSNLLKFYVQFDAPMAEQAYPYIDLLDSTGKKVERGILKEIPELWNDEKTLLCVWLEPGRIKRGLGPNEKLGPVLTPGQSYQITISEKLRDRSGIKIRRVFSKAFYTETEDRTRPNWKNWKVSISDDLKVLSIEFDEVLDFSSAIDAFSIPSRQGRWVLSEFQNSIQFYPDQKFLPGEYKIAVNPKIEDLAGNNLIRLFDQDINSTKEVSNESFELRFSVAN